MENNQLAELILTKFCHDIAGEVGALMNGAELLEESFNDAEFLKQASAALTASSKSLTGRLRFFRAAFGSPKQNYTSQMASQLATDYIATLNDTNCKWELFEDEDFALVRIKLILSLIAAGTLSRGGSVIVNKDSVSAVGINVALPEEQKQILTNGETGVEISSNAAPDIFLYNYAKQMDYKIEVNESTKEIVFLIKG